MKSTALDAPRDILDEDERRFVDTIRQHGWFHTAVPGDEEGPGFSYTTAFMVRHGFPEVILFGLDDEIASRILWNMYRAIEAGDPPAVGVPTTAFTTQPVVLLKVGIEHYREYLGWNHWFYGGNDFPCIQCVWTDRAGLFPWDAGFDAETFGGCQPDLTAGTWERETS